MPVTKIAGRDETSEALVDDLLRTLGPLMRRLRTESNHAGLSWSQRAVIGRLKRGGPATAADLARAEGVKPQSMGVTLAALERDGFLSRAPHPTDGRQFLYAITPKADDARELSRSLKRDWLGNAVAMLDEQEVAALRASLGVLRRLVGE